MKIALALAVVCSIGLFTACDKEADRTSGLELADFSIAESETELASVEAEIEEMASLPMNESAVQNSENGLCLNWRKKLPDCAEVTTSGEGYPKTIVIVFNDCEGKHGRKRNGTLTIVISEDMRNEGATRTATFKGFGQNGRTITGTKTLTNMGQNENGNYVFEKSGKMEASCQKGSFTREQSGQIEWLSGFGDGDCDNNVVSITGSSSATGPKGTHSREIMEPLIKDFSCAYFKQGVIKVSGKRGEAIIDFGEGDCDNTASVTKEGVTSEINLDEHREKRGKRRHSLRE